MSDGDGVVPFSVQVRSEFGAWSRRATLGLLILLCCLMVWVGHKVDRNYNGNPNGGTRQILCAISQDDAAASPKVADIVKEFCPR